MCLRPICEVIVYAVVNKNDIFNLEHWCMPITNIECYSMQIYGVIETVDELKELHTGDYDFNLKEEEDDFNLLHKNEIQLLNDNKCIIFFNINSDSDEFDINKYKLNFLNNPYIFNVVTGETLKLQIRKYN